jgi:hypothetical protein
MIKIAERASLWKKEEFPAEHLTRFMELAMLFGKDEIHLHHYVFEIVSFLFGR